MTLINTLNILRFRYILYPTILPTERKGPLMKPLHYLKLLCLSHINFQTPDLFLWNLVQTFGTENLPRMYFIS